MLLVVASEKIRDVEGKSSIDSRSLAVWFSVTELLADSIVSCTCSCSWSVALYFRSVADSEVSVFSFNGSSLIKQQN